jgi:hypothetical protein
MFQIVYVVDVAVVVRGCVCVVCVVRGVVERRESHHLGGGGGGEESDVTRLESNNNGYNTFSGLRFPDFADALRARACIATGLVLYKF